MGWGVTNGTTAYWAVKQVLPNDNVVRLCQGCPNRDQDNFPRIVKPYPSTAQIPATVDQSTHSSVVAQHVQLQ